MNDGKQSANVIIVNVAKLRLVRVELKQLWKFTMEAAGGGL